MCLDFYLILIPLSLKPAPNAGRIDGVTTVLAVAIRHWGNQVKVGRTFRQPLS